LQDQICILQQKNRAVPRVPELARVTKKLHRRFFRRRFLRLCPQRSGFFEALRSTEVHGLRQN